MNARSATVLRTRAVSDGVSAEATQQVQGGCLNRRRTGPKAFVVAVGRSTDLGRGPMSHGTISTGESRDAAALHLGT